MEPGRSRSTCWHRAARTERLLSFFVRPEVFLFTLQRFVRASPEMFNLPPDEQCKRLNLGSGLDVRYR